MKFTTIFLLASVLFLSLSFKTIHIAAESGRLVGTWVCTKEYKNTFNFKRKKSFEKNKKGVEFKKGGKMVWHSHYGKCGMPPVIYENYSGTWTPDTGPYIRLNFKTSRGKAEESWEIIKIDDQELVAKRVSFKIK